MTQANSKDFLPLIEAWSRGETLQFRSPEGEWEDVGFDIAFFRSFPSDYRIKPKPLELWVNVFPNSSAATYPDKESAELAAKSWSHHSPRTVHMREVTT